MFLLLRQKHMDSFCGIRFFPDFHLVSIFCVCPNSFEVRHLMQARRRPKPSVIEEEKEPWVPWVKWCQWDAGTSSFYLFCLQHTGQMNHEGPWHNLRSIAPYTLQAINKRISLCLVEKDSSKQRYLIQLANCKECTMFDVWWRLMYDIAELSAQNH